jgi:hypothetical protein
MAFKEGDTVAVQKPALLGETGVVVLSKTGELTLTHYTAGPAYTIKHDNGKLWVYLGSQLTKVGQ